MRRPLIIEELMTANALHSPIPTLADELLAGLTRSGQKQIPSKYLYDAVGSRLFDVISVLPEYGLTKAEERILRGHSVDIAARLESPVMVTELGSGSGQKTGLILRAICRNEPTTYYPIDISSTALDACCREMNAIHALDVVGLELDYIEGLSEVSRRRRMGQQLLVLFLGSTIGNFDRLGAVQFLHNVRRLLKPGDALLLGADLVKPMEQLIAAYDDPLGVTAAFNLNLLARMNREFGARFDLTHFQHEARFNAETSSVEMHLRSKCRQTVAINRAGDTATFQENETIWTESSHKYTLAEVSAMAGSSGFRCEEQWVDSQWPFADSFLTAIS